MASDLQISTARRLQAAMEAVSRGLSVPEMLAPAGIDAQALRQAAPSRAAALEAAFTGQISGATLAKPVPVTVAGPAGMAAAAAVWTDGFVLGAEAERTPLDAQLPAIGFDEIAEAARSVDALGSERGAEAILAGWGWDFRTLAASLARRPSPELAGALANARVAAPPAMLAMDGLSVAADALRRRRNAADRG